MSMSTTKEKVTVNPTTEMKEEKNMAKAFEDEMDLRDEAQIAAEETEEKALQTKKANTEVSVSKKHKKAFIIGGAVVGVAALGLGLWGVSNIGRGRTFFGRRKYHGHSHGRYNYNINKIAPAQTPVVPTPEIPAVDNSETAKVLDFAEGMAKAAETMKANPTDFKVKNL